MQPPWNLGPPHAHTTAPAPTQSHNKRNQGTPGPESQRSQAQRHYFGRQRGEAETLHLLVHSQSVLRGEHQAGSPDQNRSRAGHERQQTQDTSQLWNELPCTVTHKQLPPLPPRTFRPGFEDQGPVVPVAGAGDSLGDLRSQHERWQAIPSAITSGAVSGWHTGSQDQLLSFPAPITPCGLIGSTRRVSACPDSTHADLRSAAAFAGTFLEAVCT